MIPRSWIVVKVHYALSLAVTKAVTIGYVDARDAHDRSGYAARRILASIASQMEGWPIQRVSYAHSSGEEDELKDGRSLRKAIEAWVRSGSLNDPLELSVEVYSLLDSYGTDILRNMWANRKFSDMVVVAGTGEEFACHRAVLCSVSPVFEAMLTHKLQEGLSARVELEGIPAEVVNAFLVCIYEGRLWAEITSAHLQCLLKLADMYQLPPLIKACATVMQNSVTEDNVISTLRCLGPLCDTSPLLKEIFESIMKKISAAPALMRIVCMHPASLPEDRQVTGYQFGAHVMTSPMSRACADFDAQEYGAEYLSLRVGDTLECFEIEGDWCRGQQIRDRSGQDDVEDGSEQGWFPLGFVTHNARNLV